MTEQIKENINKKRIRNSILISFIGIALLITGYKIIFWNEEKTYNTSVVEKAVSVSADDAAAENQVKNKLVAVSGIISTDEMIGDSFEIDGTKITLIPQNVVALSREVEMYGWTEQKEAISKQNIYKTKWLSLKEIQKMASSTFSTEYKNPTINLKNDIFFTTTTQIGTYSVNLRGASDIADFSRFDLKEEDFQIESSGQKVIQVIGTEYIFIGNGTLNAPKVGDFRVKYFLLPSGQNVTMFGSVKDGKIIEYKNEKNQKFYRMFTGTREEALEHFALENSSNKWIWRIVSFIILWISFIFIIKLSIKQQMFLFLAKINQAEIVVLAFGKALLLTLLLSLLFSKVHSLFLFLTITFFTSFAILFFLIPINNKKQIK